VRAELALVLSLEVAADAQAVQAAAARELRLKPERIQLIRRIRESLDARSRTPTVQLKLEAWVDELPPPASARFAYRDVTHAEPAIVVGCGPAGLFAALRLIELGIRPIVLERGKDVRARRRDLAALHRSGSVNLESNYCFGEGGAGTYSDGKLYTRATKRGNLPYVLDTFIAHGAEPSIGWLAHPHIGTNKLPTIVSAMSDTVRHWGGEILFNSRVSELMVSNGSIAGARLLDGTSIQAKALILATGHSARDVFELLHRAGILIEAKPFALGVRIEHPQALIDSAQYRCAPGARHPLLPAAAYSLTTQAEGRGVFSFCMCPGGIIAPAATGPHEVVVNGWSPSKRNNPYANSGLVATVGEADFDARDPLSALHYQAAVERRSYEFGGGALRAPAQRLIDFLERRPSSSLPACSYQPGLTPAELDVVLPEPIVASLRVGLRAFGHQLRGYLSPEAVLVATESRTSSPVRIPRDADTLQHPHVIGLYPCGEGAGYAGGIASAAMDGIRVAESLARALSPSAQA
jgi:uncharacterized protein